MLVLAIFYCCLLLDPLSAARISPGQKWDDTANSRNITALQGMSHAHNNNSSLPGERRSLAFFTTMAIVVAPLVVSAAGELANIIIKAIMGSRSEKRENFVQRWVSDMEQERQIGWRYVAVIDDTAEVDSVETIPGHSVSGGFEDPVEKTLWFSHVEFYTYKMYTIPITKEGAFELRGPGGWENWAYGGINHPSYRSKLTYREDTDFGYRLTFPRIVDEGAKEGDKCGELRLYDDKDVITHTVCPDRACVKWDDGNIVEGPACGFYNHRNEKFTCYPWYSWACYVDYPVAESGGRCGEGVDGHPAVRCPYPQCCSKHGYCGTTMDHCSTDYNYVGEPNASPFESPCMRPHGAYGECGSSWVSGEQSSTSSDGDLPTAGMGGACGSGTAVCGSSQCCSQYGWCGVTDGHCGAGCQAGYGKCN